MSIHYCCMNDRGVGHIARTPVSTEATVSASVGAGGANHPQDVLTVQLLLNAATARAGSPPRPVRVDGLIGPETVAAIREFQQAQLGFNDGRVDPNNKTIARLNAVVGGVAAPASAGVVKGVGPVTAPTTAPPPAPAPAPPTPPTPLQKAMDAVPTATLWATLAKSHLDGLTAGLTASGGQILLPFVFNTVNTHFHLDRAPTSLLVNLQTLSRRFGHILQVLAGANGFFRAGPAVANSPFADAPMGGFHLPGTVHHFITFRPAFVTCGPNTRAAMLVHEGAHFIGGLNEIGHFAMEFPAPNGVPQGEGNTRNYAELRTDEALKNASSYAAFAIHAAFGTDLRFGAADITK